MRAKIKRLMQIQVTTLLQQKQQQRANPVVILMI